MRLQAQLPGSALTHWCWVEGKCLYTCSWFFPRTFEEDKFAVRSLVGGVDARWQALPELIDLHGVTLLYLVVPQTPEPPVLQHKEPEPNQFYLYKITITAPQLARRHPPCLDPRFKCGKNLLTWNRCRMNRTEQQSHSLQVTLTEYLIWKSKEFHCCSRQRLMTCEALIWFIDHHRQQERVQIYCWTRNGCRHTNNHSYC